MDSDQDSGTSDLDVGTECPLQASYLSLLGDIGVQPRTAAGRRRDAGFRQEVEATSLPRFGDDHTTHPVDFVARLEAWLIGNRVDADAWVDVAVTRMSGRPRVWAVEGHDVWPEWRAFRARFLDTFWAAGDRVDLVNEFFTSTYRKEYGSTAAYALHWLKKVQYLMLDKSCKAYALDRYSFLFGLSMQLPAAARAFVQSKRNMSDEELLAGLRRNDSLPGRGNHDDVHDDYGFLFL